MKLKPQIPFLIGLLAFLVGLVLTWQGLQIVWFYSKTNLSKFHAISFDVLATIGFCVAALTLWQLKMNRKFFVIAGILRLGFFVFGILLFKDRWYYILDPSGSLLVAYPYLVLAALQGLSLCFLAPKELK